MALVKSAAEILGGRPRPVDAPAHRPKAKVRNKCIIPTCPKIRWGHGYCRSHGRKFLLYGNPLWTKGQPVKCTCERCPVHQPDRAPFPRKARPPAPRGRPARQEFCDTPGCPRPHHGNGLCKTCGRKKEKWGDAQHVYVPTRTGRCGCEQHRAGGRPDAGDRRGVRRAG